MKCYTSHTFKVSCPFIRVPVFLSLFPFLFLYMSGFNKEKKKPQQTSQGYLEGEKMLRWIRISLLIDSCITNAMGLGGFTASVKY